MRSPALGVALVASSVAWGCSSGGSAAPANDIDGGAEVTAGCYQRLDYGAAPATFTCALAEPCPTVTGTADFSVGTPTQAGVQVEALDVPAAQCVLRQLRDDQRAHLRIATETPNREGDASQEIWVEGDGSAIVLLNAAYDLAFNRFRPRRFPRKDKAFFDACLLQTDLSAINTCLNSWWVDDACFAADSLPCAP
jgi:hypothetical protein